MVAASALAENVVAVEVKLALEKKEIPVGESTTARATTGTAAQVVSRGIEGRVLGGPWEKWVELPGAASAPIPFAAPESAGVYEVRAFAALDEDDLAYSNRVLLTVTATAPEITAQPAGAIATVGSTVSLAVAATGTSPAFQWRKDNVDVPGATQATLLLSPAQVAQSGTYVVVASNSAGSATSRAVIVDINPLSLPAVAVQVSRFPVAGGRQPAPVDAAQVGNVISVSSFSSVATAPGWRHNVLVRRPAITTATALPPPDGSGLIAAHAAWNTDGWGNPHVDGGSYKPDVLGQPAADLGNRAPFIHVFTAAQTSSTRAFDFVLDAPGEWLVRAEVVDAKGNLIARSPATSVQGVTPSLASDPANITYPYGRTDRFVGVFWNAGQAHRLWSTWRAEFQSAYAATWAVNWKLMWQPSPYFARARGSWLRPDPLPESPWQPFWSAHQVYAIVPDTASGSKLTHDLTSQAFAERAALRLMDVGVDFVAIDYTNQFLEESEDVGPALHSLAQAFQAVALRSQSGERIRLTAVVPANVSSGDWGRNGGFVPQAIACFNAKLTALHRLYAQFESTWFYLENEAGARRPLLLLWVGASGEDDADGKLSAAKLSQLKLEDGRLLSDVFTIRWVGAHMGNHRRFLAGGSYTVPGAEGPVTGKYVNPGFWSYHDSHPASATLLRGGTGVEAITVQPVAAGRDRFGRAWTMNWPAGQGYHYETPASAEPVPLDHYGRIWRNALTAARALEPKFLLTTWAEFGSENDEPRPELAVTVMDNNKFGTHFADAFKDAVRWFKYRVPTAWMDSYVAGDTVYLFSDTPAGAWPTFSAGQVVRLQGWVSPNVATTFSGGSVSVFVDERYLGPAVVGGAANGATAWYFELDISALGTGPHTVKVVADDGVGGTALAGVQFRGERPRSTLQLSVTN